MPDCTGERPSLQPELSRLDSVAPPSPGSFATASKPPSAPSRGATSAHITGYPTPGQQRRPLRSRRPRRSRRTQVSPYPSGACRDALASRSPSRLDRHIASCPAWSRDARRPLATIVGHLSTQFSVLANEDRFDGGSRVAFAADMEARSTWRKRPRQVAQGAAVAAVRPPAILGESEPRSHPRRSARRSTDPALRSASVGKARAEMS